MSATTEEKTSKKVWLSYIPLVLPVLGLWWLIPGQRRRGRDL